MMPCPTPVRCPPYLSALHVLSLVEAANTLASETHDPKPSWPAGPAVRGQGRGSGNPLTALGSRGQSQRPEQTKIPWSWGPGHQGPESPCCHCWAEVHRKLENVYKPLEQARNLRRKGEGGDRQSPESCLSRCCGSTHSRCLVEATWPLIMAHGPVCSGLDSCHVHTHLPTSPICSAG